MAIAQEEYNQQFQEDERRFNEIQDRIVPLEQERATLITKMNGIHGYIAITAVKDGTNLEWIATAANGWHAVKIGSQVGWVSGKYSEMETV